MGSAVAKRQRAESGVHVRNISFFYTERQVRDQSKDVTRRLGWSNAKPGDRLQACVKCMGRIHGEPLERICVIEIVSNRPELLTAMLTDPVYGAAECRREGFPEMTPQQFVDMFCKHMGAKPETVVNRIQFRYVEKTS